ncbi:hypothetical protein JG687_00008654, partial [Phytophthora cactorum]
MLSQLMRRTRLHSRHNRFLTAVRMQTIGDQTFVNPRDTRLAYADIIGEESLSGKLISAGPILERIDIFGAAVAENVACKGIATISVDRVDFKSQIAHGDLVRLEGEVIYTGSSSLAVQITGYRHDVESGKFIHTLSAIMTCVALDEDMRPSPGLPKLLDPLDPEYVRKHEEIAAQRKDLAARWRAVQEEVDQLPHVSVDMLKTYDYGRSLEVPIPDTLIEVQSSFLPKHLNRNNTIFGGEVLTWMDKVALYCARNFTKNQNMVTVSMNRIFFKLPITMDDIVTMHARISSARRHHLEVEVEVFVGRIGSNERRKSHTGYFTVANLDRSYRMKQISTDLKVDENDQESMRTLLKAQHRWSFDDQELKLLTLEPLSLSTPTTPAKFSFFSRLQSSAMSTAANDTVTVQQTRMAYASTIVLGDEHLRGKLLGLGPLLHRLDNFGGAVAEKFVDVRSAISKKVSMAALESLNMASPIMHGDVVRLEGELINIGRSSLTLQVTGCRHDIATRRFVHAVDAVMTAVALDDNNRPIRGLPELVDRSNGIRIDRLQEIAQQRKTLSMRLKKMEDPSISCQRTLSTSFLPRHLNRNGTVFGGEILSWMDKTALYCGRIFTGNSNMVTVSANRISFKLSVTTNDVATMEARVCGIREHFVDVEVEVFLKKFGLEERKKCHT